MAINQANRAIFELHLQRAYTYLFENDSDYIYASQRKTPDELAYSMTLSLCKGIGDKDGKGIAAACKAVGIKQTYKAIGAYLNMPEN